MKKPKKLSKDPNKRALEIVNLSTEEEEQPQEPTPTKEERATEEQHSEKTAIQQYLAEIGRKGGLKGGKARADKLTPEQRKEIAKKAAKSRWSKKK